MSDKYNGMNNKDFKEYCETEGIDVDSKNVSKPTRAEYIASIEKFENKMAIKVVEKEPEFEEAKADDSFLAEVESINKEVEKPVVKATKDGKETRGQKRRKQYNELMALKRVNITSNATNQTKTDGIERISWGNRLLGHQTDNVVIGKPWHVREGALRNMALSTISQSIQDDEGNQVRTEIVPAWIIQYLEPLTPDQIKQIAKKQTIRDSSIDSLI